MALEACRPSKRPDELGGARAACSGGRLPRFSAGAEATVCGGFAGICSSRTTRTSWPSQKPPPAAATGSAWQVPPAPRPPHASGLRWRARRLRRLRCRLPGMITMRARPAWEGPAADGRAPGGAAGGGRDFVRWWVHNGFVNVDAEKMSKSLGNFFTIRQAIAKYSPSALRFWLLVRSAPPPPFLSCPPGLFPLCNGSVFPLARQPASGEGPLWRRFADQRSQQRLHNRCKVCSRLLPQKGVGRWQCVAAAVVLVGAVLPLPCGGELHAAQPGGGVRTPLLPLPGCARPPLPVPIPHPHARNCSCVKQEAVHISKLAAGSP